MSANIRFRSLLKIMRMSGISVTKILNTAEGLETKSFESLYQKLYAQRVRRNGVTLLNEVESALLNEINTDFDTKKWERLQYLDWKLEFGALSVREELESLKLAEAYENYSVQRLKSIAKLAIIRQVNIDILMEQLGIHS
jgi:hypothetical protein